MTKKIIQFQSIIDGVTKKKDGTLSIKLGTQEMPPKDTAIIFELGNKQVWTALAETEVKISDPEIPKEVMEFKNSKSLSERLRNVLYVWWEQDYKKAQPDFEAFRRLHMNKLIDSVKDKLN